MGSALKDDIAALAPPAREHWRRNLRLHVSSHVLSQLGDALMNPRTSLAWLAGSLGASPAVLALLVPVRESGSLLPQPLLARWLHARAQRRGLWACGAVLQALAVLGLASLAWAWRSNGLEHAGQWPGLALLGLLALFALARALCSVTGKDVLGRSVPRGQRGRASGWAAAISGFLVLLLAGLAWAGLESGAESRWLPFWLLAAALCWLLAAPLFVGIREPAAEPSGAGRGLGLSLLLRDDLLRRFVLARGLLLGSALSPPFFVALAQQQTDGPGLLAFVAAGGVAGLVGGLVWGRLADRSSRRTLGLAAVLASLCTLGLAVAAALDLPLLGSAWLLPAGFLLVSLAHEGVRVGRKTWIVNIAEGARRIDYVAVSNAAMGALLLAVGVLTALLATVSTPGVLLLLAVIGLVGAWLGLRLPEAEAQVGDR
ncbi:MAG: MFS transporter [Aquimonas sp.]|nr:MFS transporter [Aquimonas sp.]